MSDQKHTEMLHTHGIAIHVSSETKHHVVAVCSVNREVDTEGAEAYGNHIAACWNACASLNPSAVPGLVETLKSLASVQSPNADPRFYELNGGPLGVIEKMVASASTALAAAKEGK